MSLKSWILSARPKTLTAALVPVVVATAVVSAEGLLEPGKLWLSFLALASAIFIQIGTNLVNDAADFEKGADTEERIGPQRVTQSGLISKKTVKVAAGLCFLLALFCGVPLVFVGGIPIVLIGLFSIAMGYAYTAGPFPLAYKGLGDLFVILFFGLVAVGGVYYLLTGTYSYSALIAGLQVGFLSTVLIAINNLRDIDQDKLVDKKTLAVRFGKQFVRWEIFGLFFVTLMLNVFWYLQLNNFLAALLPLMTLGLIYGLVKSVFLTEPSRAYNQFLARAAMIQMLFCLQLTVGLVLT